MKIKLFLTVLLLPVLAFSQKTETFLSILDASNVPIKGTATKERYENTIIINSLQADAQTTQRGGKVNNQISFTMPICGASAEFKRALSTGRTLPKGDFSVVTSALSVMVNSMIRVEEVTILSCTDAVGCNGAMSTTVVLVANRIGWTYYTPNKAGVNTISKKFGWDAQMNREWTGF